jgi:hypothetical protein
MLVADPGLVLVQEVALNGGEIIAARLLQLLHNIRAVRTLLVVRAELRQMVEAEAPLDIQVQVVQQLVEQVSSERVVEEVVEIRVEEGVVLAYTHQLLQTVLPMAEEDQVVKVQQLRQVVYMAVDGVLGQLAVDTVEVEEL